jgi:hypothetical protein
VNAILFAAAALLLAAALYRVSLKEKRQRAEAIASLYSEAKSIIEETALEDRSPSAYPRLTGAYQGFAVQLTPIIDTLATRRLPALWMQVTLPAPLPVTAKFDMMMRPAGPTTFSNFDLLPHAIPLPSGYPEEALARSDAPHAPIDPAKLLPHVRLFNRPKAKELLIAPNGLRIVWLVAEADRLRYGVFRQADFANATMSAEDLRDILDTLLKMRKDILTHEQATL